MMQGFAEVVVTDHAAQRLQERLGIPEAVARERIAEAMRSVSTIAPAQGGCLKVRTAGDLVIRAIVEPGDPPRVVTVMPGDKGNSPSDTRYRRRGRVKLALRIAEAQGMRPLRVVAHTPAGVARNDPWSPSLDGILAYWHLGEQRGGVHELEVDDSAMAPVEGLPLLQERYKDRWWWCCSSPEVATVERHERHYHRRFDLPSADRYLDGGTRKVPLTAGLYKNRRMSDAIEITPAVTWHCIGDPERIERLLRRCTQIGGGRARGMGVVERWEVLEGGDPERALYGRPVPVEYAETHALDGPVMLWGLAPPGRLPGHQARCVMPTAPAAGP